MAISALSTFTSAAPAPGSDSSGYLRQQLQALERKIADEKCCKSTDDATKQKTVQDLEAKKAVIDAKLAKTAQSKKAADDNQPAQTQNVNAVGSDYTQPVTTSGRLFDLLV